MWKAVNIPVFPAPLAGAAPMPEKKTLEVKRETCVESCLHGQDLSSKAANDLSPGWAKGISSVYQHYLLNV